MALLPGAWLPWIEGRFLIVTASGLEPNSGGWVYTFAAGTSTPLATYSNVTLTVANPTEIELDSEGRIPSNIYLLPQGYKFVVYDADLVQQYTVDNIEDIGQTFATTFGTLQTDGSKAVTSGYTVLATDRLVTVASTGGPDPCIVNLPAADEYTALLTIKNVGTIDVDVTPNGIQTIDSVAAAYTIPAAASPSFPSLILASDGVSAWWILGSHKVP